MKIKNKDFKNYLKTAWEHGKNDMPESNIILWIETIYMLEMRKQ